MISTWLLLEPHWRLPGLDGEFIFVLEGLGGLIFVSFIHEHLTNLTCIFLSLTDYFIEKFHWYVWSHALCKSNNTISGRYICAADRINTCGKLSEVQIQVTKMERVLCSMRYGQLVDVIWCISGFFRVRLCMFLFELSLKTHSIYALYSHREFW